MGVVQMQRIEEILTRRAGVAALYQEFLGESPELELPPQTETDGRISWFVYVVRVTGGDASARRDEIMRQLGEDGVQCGRYFAPIHQQGAYADFGPHAPLPVTERESGRTLALPFFTTMTREQVRYVSERLRDALATR